MKTFFSMLFSFLLVLSALAQEKGLFWKVEKKGYPTSYLYGTMHLKDARIFSFDKSVEAAIKKSQLFFTELDMKNIDVAAITEDMPLPQGTGLRDLYTDSTDFETVKTFLDQHFGHYGTLLYSFKPFYIEVFMADQFTNSDYPMALDEYLVGIASEATVETKGLETLAEQIETVNTIPLKQQAQDLLLIIKGYEATGIKAENEKIINAYLAQDLVALDAIINTYTSETALFKQKFITERNATMVRRLLPALKKSTTFCAIGAGHLPGKDGVIRLLQTEGFTVSQIPFTFNTKEK